MTGDEIGGQMQLMAETFRKKGYRALAAPLDYNDFREYTNDVRFKMSIKRDRLSRSLFFIWALSYFDVFHFNYGVSSFWSFWRFHMLDLPIMKLFKKTIVVHFRGLDVVDIRYFDYLREIAEGSKVEIPPMSRPDQKRRIKKWLNYADTILVSEPDLHFVSTSSILLPQVIDMKYWTPTTEPQSKDDGIIRIVHAPTNRRKKGTEFIEQSVAKLKLKGYRLELVLAENLPNYKIKELYEKSDIGIDQMLYGWYGKVSVELMALGKPVICYINPEYEKYRPDLPIVHADINSLPTVLEGLIIDKVKRISIGEASRNYVAKYHDVEKETDRLLGLYMQHSRNKSTKSIGLTENI